MGTGIICILAAAFMNSVGYLASARFMKRYNSPVHLLIVAQVCMMALSIPFLPFVFPFGHVHDMQHYWLVAAGWEAVFIVGQCSFFIAQKYFESSRLSSLLGLKIIVLTVIFITMKSGHVNGGQWLAVATLENRSRTPALMLRLDLVGERSGEQILPVFYEDNWISLLPGERKEIRVRCAAADTRGERPALRLSGFNLR